MGADADTLVNAQSEVMRIRMADGESRDEATRAAPPPATGAPSFVAKTTTVTAYPTAANAYYAVVPQAALGAETEGGAGTLTARNGRAFAYNLGTAVPPSGTAVVVTYVPHRWVFRYDG